MRGSGGTPGGVGMFLLGLALTAGAAWLFFDSVWVRTGHGWVSGLLRGRQGGDGLWQTTSMGILFVPFLLGVIALFYDARLRWAWGLLYLGLGILAVEILSRIRFDLQMKTTHLLLMLTLFGAGLGLMLRSYRDTRSILNQAAEDQEAHRGTGRKSTPDEAQTRANPRDQA